MEIDIFLMEDSIFPYGYFSIFVKQVFDRGYKSQSGSKSQNTIHNYSFYLIERGFKMGMLMCTSKYCYQAELGFFSALPDFECEHG